jgi:hypothetical protein
MASQRNKGTRGRRSGDPGDIDDDDNIFDYPGGHLPPAQTGRGQKRPRNAQGNDPGSEQPRLQRSGPFSTTGQWPGGSQAERGRSRSAHGNGPGLEQPRLQREDPAPTTGQRPGGSQAGRGRSRSAHGNAPASRKPRSQRDDPASTTGEQQSGSESEHRGRSATNERATSKVRRPRRAPGAAQERVDAEVVKSLSEVFAETLPSSIRLAPTFPRQTRSRPPP